MPDMTVIRNDRDHRYEGRLDGGPDVAVVHYRRRADVDPPVVVMTHTEVPESMRGEGACSELVRQSLDDVRKQGARLLPECPFVESWVDAHPDYQDLLTPDAY